MSQIILPCARFTRQITKFWMSTLWVDEKKLRIGDVSISRHFCVTDYFFSLNHNVIQIIVFQVTREVERRIEDLTHQVHREILTRSVDQVKTLAPILICSMKIFIQIVLQGSWYIFLLKRKRLVWDHKDGVPPRLFYLFKEFSSWSFDLQAIHHLNLSKFFVTI